MNEDLISRHATIRFIRDKVSLALFMKRSVDKADKACWELCEMLDRELPSAQPEQRWIPCSERLPEKAGIYLVTNTKWGYPEQEICVWLPRSKKWGTRGEPIAWMPLPEPYKGE